MPDRLSGRIGLLGGSFNPAHEGHVHISNLAMEHLELDEVWWLVSPQNPLKQPDDMAPFANRVRMAVEMAASNSRIIVTDVERELGTRYTIDTVSALKANHPDARFVWVMGADLLNEVSRWKGWRELFRSIPIAVFARPSYSFRALSGKAARRFSKSRIRRSRIGALADMRPPAWSFLRTRLSPQSATQIRARNRR